MLVREKDKQRLSGSGRQMKVKLEDKVKLDASSKLDKDKVVGKNARQAASGVPKKHKGDIKDLEQHGSGFERTWQHQSPQSPMWGILPMMVLMGLAFCLHIAQASTQPDALQVVLVFSLMWCSSSIAINVVNKVALVAVPFPMTILLLQMLIADGLLIIGCGPKQLYKELREHSQYASLWGLPAVLFSGGMLTSLLALQAGSVTLMLVVRNVMPLLCLAAERFLIPEATPPISWDSALSLAMVALGTCLYAFLQMHVAGTWHALGYLALNMSFVLARRLMERRLLLQMPQSLSLGAIALVQNVLGLPLVLCFLLFRGEQKASMTELVKSCHNPSELTVLFFSGCVVLAFGYYGIALQKHITATYFMTLQAFAKMMTAVLAVLVLGERPDMMSLVGIIISMCGATWYGFISNPSVPEPATAPVSDSGCDSDPANASKVVTPPVFERQESAESDSAFDRQESYVAELKGPTVAAKVEHIFTPRPGTPAFLHTPRINVIDS